MSDAPISRPSIYEAFSDATTSVLGRYLAPELAEDLARQILEQARAHVVGAIDAAVGFPPEPSKPVKKKTAAKKKAAKAPKEPAAPRPTRKVTVEPKRSVALVGEPEPR
jgi:hypothetical protein